MQVQISSAAERMPQADGSRCVTAPLPLYGLGEPVSPISPWPQEPVPEAVWRSGNCPSFSLIPPARPSRPPDPWHTTGSCSGSSVSGSSPKIPYMINCQLHGCPYGTGVALSNPYSCLQWLCLSCCVMVTCWSPCWTHQVSQPLVPQRDVPCQCPISPKTHTILFCLCGLWILHTTIAFFLLFTGGKKIATPPNLSLSLHGPSEKVG